MGWFIWRGNTDQCVPQASLTTGEPCPTYNRLARSWLAETTPFLEPRSIAAYKSGTRGFGNWLKEKRCGLTVQSIKAWTAEKLASGSPNAVIQIRATLRRCFAWGMEHGQCDMQYVAKIRSLVPQPSDRTNFSAEEYLKIRDYRGWPKDLWFLGHVAAVCWETGLRISDVCNLRWEQVDLDNGTIRLTPQKTRRFGKTVEVPISEALRRPLNVMLVQHRGNPSYCPEAGSPFVFPVMAYLYGSPGGISIPRQALAAACVSLGIPKGKSWHALRHSFVTKPLLCAGVSPAVVGSMTGQSLATLQRYCHPDIETKRAALALTATSPRPEIPPTISGDAQQNTKTTGAGTINGQQPIEREQL